jgi:hypothetical protein
MTPSQTPEARPETTPRPWTHANPIDGPGESMIYGADGFTVGNTLMFDNEEYIRACHAKGREPYASLLVPREQGAWNADAILIVEAVNAYDRLLRIEAAARKLTTFLPGPPNGANPPGPFVNAATALRAALEEQKP